MNYLFWNFHGVSFWFKELKFLIWLSNIIFWKYFIIDNEMDIPVDTIGIKKEKEDINMDKSTKSPFDNEDENNNNKYDYEYNW